MFDPKQIDDLTQGILNIIPPGIKDLQKDVEKNIHSALQSTFAKMDLVTREEFDVQSAVLARTRARLETLEAKVAELEQKVLGK